MCIESHEADLIRKETEDTKRTETYDSLKQELDKDFERLGNEISRLLRIASEYKGYDFSEDILEEIEELL